MSLQSFSAKPSEAFRVPARCLQPTVCHKVMAQREEWTIWTNDYDHGHCALQLSKLKAVRRGGKNILNFIKFEVKYTTVEDMK